MLVEKKTAVASKEAAASKRKEKVAAARAEAVASKDASVAKKVFGLCLKRRCGQNISTHPVHTESNVGRSNFDLGSIPVRFEVDQRPI